MTSFIQIAVVVLLLYWCFLIISPFLNVVVWGMLISVALYPVHQTVSAKMGGKPKAAATLFVVIGVASLLIPTWMIGSSGIQEAKAVAQAFQAGEIEVPPPNEKVAEWPLIGEPLHKHWSNAAADVESTVNEFKPQLAAFGKWLFAASASSIFGVLGFVFSVIIAGVFMLCADGAYKAACALAHRVAGKQGQSLTDLSIQTIRSVTKGVLGVAIIQAILSVLLLFFWGVPAAGILAGIILVLAVVQLPPLLVLGPIAIWVFSNSEPLSATVFAILAFVISISDSFLKPMFLGKGVDVPMLVILIGAIGGAMVSGVLGLFVGAVVLAVGYKLMQAWLAMDTWDDASDSTE